MLHFLSDAAHSSSGGLTLLMDASFKATLVLVLATTLCWFLRRNSAAVRHRIWMVALGCSLLMPAAALMPRTIAVLPANGNVAPDSDQIARDVDRSTATLPMTSPASQPTDRDRAAPEDFLRTRGFDAGRVRTVANPAFSFESVEALAAFESQLAGPASTSSSARLSAIILAVWLAGVILTGIPFMCATVIQWLRTRKLRQIQDGQWTTTSSSRGWSQCYIGSIRSLGTRCGGCG
jgi:hypothetical protein